MIFSFCKAKVVCRKSQLGLLRRRKSLSQIPRSSFFLFEILFFGLGDAVESCCSSFGTAICTELRTVLQKKRGNILQTIENLKYYSRRGAELRSMQRELL